MIDEELICRDYENAAHPAAQVRIICELHALDVNTVKEILRKHGKNVPEAIPDIVGAKADAHSTHSGWTEEKARTLRALAEQGLCAKEIAERMGYTGDTIRKRALAAGIKVRYGQRKIDEERFRELAREHTAREIADIMGFVVGTIWTFSKRNGIEMVPERKKRQKKAAL